MPEVPFIGKQFGEWAIIAAAPPGVYGHKRFLCECRLCRGQKSLFEYEIGKSFARKCDCRKQRYKHGRTNMPEYGVWKAMMRRCYKKNDTAYKDYGGRGIIVAEQWHNFDNFIQDMGARPSTQHQLERHNNNQSYSKNNCSWQTRSVQMRNTRRTQLYTANGITLCLKDWAAYIEIPYSNLLYRIHSMGWSLEQVFDAPQNQSRLHMVTIAGKTMTVTAWSHHFGINPSRVFVRLHNGWDVLRALTTPLKLQAHHNNA